MEEFDDDVDAAIKRMRQAALPDTVEGLRQQIIQLESQAMRDRVEYRERLQELEGFRRDYQPLIWYLAAGVATLFLIVQFGKDAVQGWGYALSVVAAAALIAYVLFRATRAALRWALRKAQ